MKKWLFIVLLCLSFGRLWATHQRAAEITYEHLHGYTYKFTITSYTFTGSPADRPYLSISWGYQNKYDEIPRAHRIVRPNEEIQENYYYVEHTFPGPGTYVISMEDANRNGGVINLPNSINTPMYVETTLIISPFFPNGNSSPTLLNQPIDKGCLGIPFIHNPGAFDPDGDSLAYSLIRCKGADGLEVPNYSFPAAKNSLDIHPVTGTLTWDHPVQQGEYNIAILIEEFRQGVKIGTITRDMQVTIQVCDNRLPEIDVPEKICVFAGDTIEFDVTATDPDTADLITLTGSSGIFSLPLEQRASFPSITGPSPLVNTFFWAPKHEQVRSNPYPVYFKALDNGDPNLNNQKTLLIYVIGKAPEWRTFSPDFNQIYMSWDIINDTNIGGYKIFRSTERTNTQPGECDFGFSDEAYQLIANLRGYQISDFIDSVDIEQNVTYCYRILAYYKNMTESQISEEYCTALLSDKPIIERVNVIQTNPLNGQIELQWRKPIDLDIFESNGDFDYVIHKALGNGDFEVIDTIYDPNDTNYIESLLNTANNIYNYKIELIEKVGGNPVNSYGYSSRASSVFLSAVGKNRRVTLQWQYEHPWKNENFTVFRADPGSSTFDSIANTTAPNFTDPDVLNDQTYTYKIKANGRYQTEGLSDWLINFSQEVSCTPHVDTPCRPILYLDFTECSPPRNGISWDPEADCSDEGVTYHVFFRVNEKTNFQEIATQNTSSYTHENIPSTMGCYYVVSSNINGVYGPPSDTICVPYENCLDYELPNFFSPNNDGYNDTYKAFPHQFSGHFTITIYGRWGNLVFESNDPNFEWDGNNKQGKPCTEGTYFYVAELLLPGLEERQKVLLQGYITLLR